MTLFAKLSKIQEKLNVPKEQYSQFGNFYYRSCEDIVEAVKPLLIMNGLTMTMSDELVMIGDRYYIKATVSIIDIETGEKHEVTAFAREAEKKKGMDESQITGAASSYARKYALNGMFAIDDVKDADAIHDTEHKDQSITSSKQKITKETVLEIIEYAKKSEKAKEFVARVLKDNNFSEWKDLAKLTENEGRNVVKRLEELIKQ